MVAGVVDWLEISDGMQSRAITRLHKHPKYDKSSDEYNVALAYVICLYYKKTRQFYYGKINKRVSY